MPAQQQYMGLVRLNGVIQITTKKGSSGAPTVSLSTNFGFTRAYEIRKVLDGPGYVNMRVNLMKTVRGNIMR